MSVLVRAADAPARSRVEYWQHVVGDTLGVLDVRADGVDAGDRLLLGSVGAVRVGELTTGRPGGAIRNLRHIRRSNLDVCKIDVLVSGRGVVQQDGREADLRPGDFTLVDLARPVRWAMSPMRVVAVVFPRALLPLRQDDAARLTAVRIPGEEGVGALVSSLARQLVGHLDDHGGTDATRLGTAALDLLTVALADRLQRPRQAPPDSQRRVLLQRVHAFVEQRLDDRRLSPGTIAAAHHVSVRYLYKLFEAQPTGVAGHIRRRRLERCRRDLLDPALRARPVSAIAARWGLPNAAHFSRAFRAAYGMPPVEYRAMNDPTAPGPLEPPAADGRPG
jgi:AraC-like DNA-binding protein